MPEDDSEHRESALFEERDYDLHVDLKEGEQPSLILYRQRWLVLLSYFLTSAATGIVTGSLSTNRVIVMNVYDVSLTILQVAKYADLLLYIPANFASTRLIEKRGLRSCVVVGTALMIAGTLIRALCIATGNFWFFFFGQIVCVSG